MGKINEEEYETRVTDRLSSVEGGANSFSSLDNKIQKLNEILVKEAVDLLPSKPKTKRKTQTCGIESGNQASHL